MKVKGIIALILTTIFIIPSTIMASEMDKELESLILIVKEKIEVPKECTEFNYDVQSNEEGVIYNLHWSTKDRDKVNIHVEVEQEGNIIGYSNYTYKEEYSILAKASYEQGLKSAKDFIAKIELPYKNDLHLYEQANITQGSEYTYLFYDYENGIKVKDRRVDITVDKQTGKVTHFKGPRTYKGTYDKATPKLSLNDAKKAYLEKIEIPLVYKLYYDYKQNGINSFPAYMVYNINNKAIDALTGEVITGYNSYGVYAGGSKMESESALDEQVLTPQEQKATEEAKHLISKHEAKQKAEKYFKRIKEADIQNATLNKFINSNEYVWNLHLTSKSSVESMYLSVNAETGEILSYYCYLDAPNDKIDVKEEGVKEKVEVFLKNIAKGKYPLTRYKNKKEEILPMPSETENTSLMYDYERLVNGIPVSGNGLSVVYNTYYDEITSYSNTWNEIIFKDILNVVSEDKIVDLIGLELMYIDKDKSHKVLAYTHEETVMAFDPFTAKSINYYDGTPYHSEKRAFYDDVKGHPKEAIIRKLYDSGVMLPGKSLKPNEKINQLDFLRLVLKESSENVSDENIYDRAIAQGILSESEKDSTHNITKEEAIKYIINSTPYKKVASLTEIYRYPYEDEKEVDEKLKGYVALAYGLGIIEKDQTNLLTPKETLTRAEAMQMIYNLIK